MFHDFGGLSGDMAGFPVPSLPIHKGTDGLGIYPQNGIPSPTAPVIKAVIRPAQPSKPNTPKQPDKK
jgi:hypothetical protein